jgi:hypothetical protein
MSPQTGSLGILGNKNHDPDGARCTLWIWALPGKCLHPPPHLYIRWALVSEDVQPLRQLLSGRGCGRGGSPNEINRSEWLLSIWCQNWSANTTGWVWATLFRPVGNSPSDRQCPSRQWLSPVSLPSRWGRWLWSPYPAVFVLLALFRSSPHPCTELLYLLAPGWFCLLLCS